ncbi:MAG: hypothetical protein JXA07_11640, partial [Spirochaetes bacterium]|nr:hypothetical protein [Spirochaetota bacterium]
ADIGAGNDIEYRVEAIDNLGSVRTSGTRRYDVTLTCQPGSMTINPATLDIAAGFERYMRVQGVDNNGTTFSLVPETFTMAYAGAELDNRFAQGILLRAVTRTPAGTPDQLIAGFDSESAIASVNIYAGELESIEILDTNGLTIPGDLAVSEGTSYAFDVVGHDGYGNFIPVLPVWSADVSIGVMDPDGVLDTTGCHGPGVVTASLAYLTDTQNVYVQSREKEITAFSINGVDGEIAYPFITVTLPWGTDVTELVAVFTTTGTGVTVDDFEQESGVTANDFTDPVVYRVTAEDGSTQDYTVQVRMLSPYKDITAFSINGVNGVINDTNITVTLPYGTDVTALIAEFTTTGQSVSVESVVQQTGVTANDFTNPVVYTVTAEDTSINEYSVTVQTDLLGLVSHFAGTIGGPGYEDGIGSNARFYNAMYIEADGENLYVADTGNHTIRKVDIDTNEVTTIAGQPGEQGYVNGIGTVARFNSPRGIITDGTNLYIADLGSQTIRKMVISTGQVSLLAGSPGNSGSSDGIATAARFYSPTGLTLIGTDLYVTDGNNHTIRRIDLTTGEVNTIAGLARTSGSTDGIGTEARFNYPIDITNDGSNLYISDSQNVTVRKIVIATGEVSTIAGQAGSRGTTDGIGTAARFSNTYGIACDGTSLYVNTGVTMRKIDIATLMVTTVAGGQAGSIDGIGTEAQFNSLYGISCDGINLYMTETNNSTIRKMVIATNAVTTIAGMVPMYGSEDGIGSAARFASPHAVVGDNENLYVADTSNFTIRKIAIASEEVTTLAGQSGARGNTDGIGSAAQFNWPTAITLLGANLYITEHLSHTIRKIVISTGEVTTIAGATGIIGSTDGNGTVARFNFPISIANDGTDLYVAERMNHTIRKIDIATSEVTTLAGLAGTSGYADGIGSAALFNEPYGIAASGGNLYVIDRENDAIRKISIATGEVTTEEGGAIFFYPSAITADSTYLYIIDYGLIRKLKIATGEVTSIAGKQYSFGSTDGIGTAARINLCWGISRVGNYLYLADTYNHCIRKIE